jgi:hypothetical protein
MRNEARFRMVLTFDGAQAPSVEPPVRGPGDVMSRNTEQEATNKALVREAFETLFNRRDYVAAERYWSPHYLPSTGTLSRTKRRRSSPALERYPGLREAAERDGMTSLPVLPEQFRRPNPAP